ICLARLFSTFYSYLAHRDLHSFPTRRSSDLGTYTFSTILFIPSGSGPATIRFESQEVVSPDLPTVFLHLDFMPDNRVRIDDDPGTLFGTFPHDQVFIVQVTLKIDASAATAHTVLSGAGASGQAD